MKTKPDEIKAVMHWGAKFPFSCGMAHLRGIYCLVWENTGEVVLDALKGFPENKIGDIYRATTPVQALIFARKFYKGIYSEPTACNICFYTDIEKSFSLNPPRK